VAAAAISFVLISLLTSIHIERTILGLLALAAILVFSGMLSRSLVGEKGCMVKNEHEAGGRIELNSSE
jgi:hypothetical protein